MQKLLSASRLERLGILAWYALLFLQVFNKFGALRLLAALVLLATLTIMSIRNLIAEHRIGLPHSIALMGMLLTTWIITVSAVGPYPVDSLHALRKDLLTQILLFSGGWLFVNSSTDAWRALGVILVSFLTLTLLSVIEIVGYWSTAGFTTNIPHGHDQWTGGYGAIGAILVPATIAWAFMPGRATHMRQAALMFSLLAIVLVVLYWGRTHVIVMLLGIALILFLARQWRLLIAIFLSVAVCVVLLATSTTSTTERYRSLLHPQTYVSNIGLSMRPALWQGTLEVISQRPILGYGYGWKKLAWAINDQGFAALWSADKTNSFNIFLTNGKASYGRVNPHNYFLQVVFEIGIPGLVLVVTFWVMLMRHGIGLLRYSNPKDLHGFAIAGVGFLVTYWASNFTNGLWVGSLANLSLAVGGMLVALSCVKRSSKG